ncbi:MAG: hypothetical protein ACLR1T_09710 [Evtepia gabavorous]
MMEEYSYEASMSAVFVVMCMRAISPKECPQCKAPASKFVEQGPEMSWAAEHVVGVARGAPRGYYGGPAGQFQWRVHRGRHVPGHEPGGVSGKAIPRSGVLAPGGL